MAASLDQPVADFSAAATSGQQVSLNALKGQQVVIYFYPKDSTPGCTTEGLDFRARYAEFQAANTQVFGVSMDSLKKHESFKCKQDFPFELISDPEHELCDLFGVYQLKKNYGKEYMGIVRSTFLLDANGVLREEWRNLRVAGHVDAVLAAAQALHKG
jgi:peroxiredoxin Q/BCP